MPVRGEESSVTSVLPVRYIIWPSVYNVRQMTLRVKVTFVTAASYNVQKALVWLLYLILPPSFSFEVWPRLPVGLGLLRG